MMKFVRLFKILVVIKRYQLVPLLPKQLRRYHFLTFLKLLFWVKKKSSNDDIGIRLRLAAEELGPVWIKFGQMLSTRRDLLPENIAKQLTKLQDQVKPFDGDLAKKIIETALGKPIEEDFDQFSIHPLASASIAQIHTAILKSSGAQVIIKVIRPNLKPVIESDIKVMYWFAKWLEKHVTNGVRLQAKEIVKDYEQTIYKELNLLQEAENSRRLRDNFIDSDMLYIPYVYPEFSRCNVMVQERVFGIPISDMEQIIESGLDIKLLAERGVTIFFTQVFRDNFFHADMHPGNIFIDASDPKNPKYIGIDCAIVGKLSSDDRNFLAQNFIAFFNRDYRKIAELYIQSGWVAPETDLLALESALQKVCDPIFAKSLGELSFAQVLLSLFNVARQFDMVIQPQLVLLEKTLFYIEGLGRELYPELDLWATAKPFLEKWYQEQLSVRFLFKQFKDSFPEWRTLFPELPAKIKYYDQQQRIDCKKIEQLEDQLNQVRKKQNWYTSALIIFLVLFICDLFLK
ncbi:ubiquinone biosynthesis regulatory protein kinase UbiB [Orbaceae bacterium ac157xtp]